MSQALFFVVVEAVVVEVDDVDEMLNLNVVAILGLGGQQYHVQTSKN